MRIYGRIRPPFVISKLPEDSERCRDSLWGINGGVDTVAYYPVAPDNMSD